MSKWEHRPHWEFEALFLGSDDRGDWIGIPAGTFMSRPGAEVTTAVNQVSLVPTTGLDAERAWLATFHALGGSVNTYVDISTPPMWDGNVLRATDLDLDVVRETTGEIWVDDEDEFAEHRVRFGYPAETVELALNSCARIRRAMEAKLTPFDGVADLWLDEVAHLGAG